MKIAIISDIHDNRNNLIKAIKILNKESPNTVFFCGDLVSPSTLKFFQELKPPVKAVWGNNEGDKITILRKIKDYKINLDYPGKRSFFLKGKIGNFKFAVFHGHSASLTETLLQGQTFDLLFTGHTHKPHLRKVKKTLWINPGTLTNYADTKALVKPSLAFFDLTTQKPQIFQL